MVSLSVMTWVRFLVWLDLGMIIYWFYGRTHSPLVEPGRGRARGGLREPRELPEDGRLHADLQRLLHHAARPADRVGRHDRELAKWHELDDVLNQWFGLHINPEIADAFGLKILGVGLVAVVARLRARAVVVEEVGRR